MNIDSIQAALAAISDFRIDHGASLTDEQKAKIRELASAPSPVDQCVNMAEFLYARRDELPEAGKVLGAALASFCAQNGWHGLLTDNRGQNMMAVMLDAASSLPTGVAVPETAPEPRAEYADEAQAGESLALPVPDSLTEPVAPAGGKKAKTASDGAKSDA